jgi:hypothetical protein
VTRGACDGVLCAQSDATLEDFVENRIGSGAYPENLHDVFLSERQVERLDFDELTYLAVQKCVRSLSRPPRLLLMLMTPPLLPASTLWRHRTYSSCCLLLWSQRAHAIQRV